MDQLETKRVRTTSEESENDALHPYGHMLEKVGQYLTKDNVAALATLAGLTPNEKDQLDRQSANGSRLLFSFLEQLGLISKENVTWLQESVLEIKNINAAEIVENFICEAGKDFELPSEPEYSDDNDEYAEASTFRNFLRKVDLEDQYPGKLKLKTLLQLRSEKSNYVQIFWQKLTSLNYHSGLLEELISQNCSMQDFIFCVLHCAEDCLRQDILEKMSACQLAVPVVLQGVENGKPIFLLWALRRVMKKWRGQSDPFAIEQPIVSYPVLTISVLRIGDVNISKSQLLNTMLSDTQGYPSHTFFLNKEKSSVVPKFSLGSIECVWFLPMWKSEKQIFKEVIAFFNLRGDCTKYREQAKFLCRAAHLTIALVATKNHKVHREDIALIKSNAKSTLFISVLNDESNKGRIKDKDGCLFINFVETEILSRRICDEIVQKYKIERKDRKSLECLPAICGNSIQVDEEDEDCREARRAVRKMFEQTTLAPELDVRKFKEVSFPLQAVWKDLVEIDKTFLHAVTEGQDYHNQMESKSLAKKNKRKIQRQKGLSPTMIVYLSTIKHAQENSTVLQYILGFMHGTIYQIVNKNTVNDMDDIAKLEKEIKNAGMTMSEGNGNGSNKQGKSKIGDKEILQNKIDECKKLYENCRANNLGSEHFLRELGQLYEACMDQWEAQFPPAVPCDSQNELQNPETEERDSKTENGDSKAEPLGCRAEAATITCNVALFPSMAARLLSEMQTLEIMDGDTGYVPETWVTSILKTLTRDLEDPKVLVLSVIGVQSSGKSTLLNSMFGVRFPVRAGRCTRGVFMRLLELDDRLAKELGFPYLIVVDTEGIRSIDHSGPSFDNRLVTLALGIANVTVFNIEGENIGTDITGILKIAAHALMRMREVDLYCRCRIVQQRVSDMMAADRNRTNTKKLEESLNEATKLAAEEEGLEGRYQQFSDVVDLQFNEDLQYVPCLWTGGMGPPNHMYSEKVTEIRDKLFEDVKKGSVSVDLTLSTFTERLQDVWWAIKEEHFIFNFQDSVRAVDFNKFCLEYNQWIVKMRQEVHEKVRDELSLVQADSEKGSLQPDINDLKKNVASEMKTQHGKLRKSVKDYIAKHPRRNMMLKYTQEFLCDVEVVLNDVQDHLLEKIGDQYDVKKITLNLPKFQMKSRAILTVEAKAEARKLRDKGEFPVNVHSYFDTILWPKMMEKLRQENKIRSVPMTVSSLQYICEKLLLKVTRDMSIGSEIRKLLSEEGGIIHHITLGDCSSYISDKFVKSWLRNEIVQKTGVIGKNTVEGKERFHGETEGQSFVTDNVSLPKPYKIQKVSCKSDVSETRKTFRHEGTSKPRINPDTEKQLMKEKKQEAVTSLGCIIEEQLRQMQQQSKGFDANLFQLTLQKTLKDLSTKQTSFKNKLPPRLIAKGLLHFCSKSLASFCNRDNDDEIETFLNFDKNEILKEFTFFLYNMRQEEIAAGFISYYVTARLSDEIDRLNLKVDYNQYQEHVEVPWDLLIYYGKGDIVMEEFYLHNMSLDEAVDRYIGSTYDDLLPKIGGDQKAKIEVYLSGFIHKMSSVISEGKTWEELCKSLGDYVDCPFIKKAADIFEVTKGMVDLYFIEEKIRERVYSSCEGVDYASVVNTAGLSNVCDEVCPMCDAWCDNILESHKVHSSSLHRPRGLKGETYSTIDAPIDERTYDVSKSKTGASGDSDSSSGSDSESDPWCEELVLEDCYKSILSDKATFTYNGQTYLCKNYKEVFPNWDIRPGRESKAGKLFWQWYFAWYIENRKYGYYYYDFVFPHPANIPESWKKITEDEALNSLEQAKFAKSHRRSSTENVPPTDKE